MKSSNEVARKVSDIVGRSDGTASDARVHGCRMSSTILYQSRRGVHSLLNAHGVLSWTAFGFAFDLVPLQPNCRFIRTSALDSFFFRRFALDLSTLSCQLARPPSSYRFTAPYGTIGSTSSRTTVARNFDPHSWPVQTIHSSAGGAHDGDSPAPRGLRGPVRSRPRTQPGAPHMISGAHLEARPGNVPAHVPAPHAAAGAPLRDGYPLLACDGGSPDPAASQRRQRAMRAAPRSLRSTPSDGPRSRRRRDARCARCWCGAVGVKTLVGPSLCGGGGALGFTLYLWPCRDMYS